MAGGLHCCCSKVQLSWMTTSLHPCVRVCTLVEVSKSVQTQAVIHRAIHDVWKWCMSSNTHTLPQLQPIECFTLISGDWSQGSLDALACMFCLCICLHVLLGALLRVLSAGFKLRLSLFPVQLVCPSGVLCPV
eukprot:6487236-Amphidinium_carterae.2